MFKKLEKISFYLFVFFLPFSLKKVVFLFGNFLSNYQMVFLYLADIFLLFTLLLWLRRVTLREIIRSLKKEDCFLLSFIFLAFFSSIFSSYPVLGFSKASRLVLAFLLYFYLKGNLNFLGINRLLVFILASGSFQALIAILQFFKQASLGLHFLGEPIFSPLVLGVAKFSLQGVKFIRPPGLLPHANILAAYLFFSLGVLSYFWLQRNSSKNFNPKKSFSGDVSLFLVLFLLLLSLLLTFSRSGWVVSLFFFSSLVVILAISKRFKKYRSKISSLFLFSLLLVLIFSFIFKDFLFVRASLNLKEKAISLRLLYQKMSLSLIKSHPVFGVGFSNYLSYLTKHNLWQQYGLKYTYLFQPVHNIYLLIASELGLFGLFLFLAFLFLILMAAAKKIFAGKNSLAILIFLLVELGFLLWGFSDHFLFDLPQGIYLFWLSTGILAGLSKS